MKLPIYQRNGIYYADLRSRGGTKVSLETTNEDEAMLQYADRVRALTMQAAMADNPPFLAYATAVWTEKDDVTDSWRRDQLRHLRGFVDWFTAQHSAAPLVAQVTPKEVAHYLTHLKREGYSDGSRRHHLNAISHTYRHAIALGYVTVNPAAVLVGKPNGVPVDGGWLTARQGALLVAMAEKLAAAKHLHPMAARLILAYLTSGLREREMLGLVHDDCGATMLRVRENRWRRLKTKASSRDVPMWPQLRAALQPSDAAVDRHALVFPSPRTGLMLNELRPWLDRVGLECQRAALDAELHYPRTRMFRRSYTALRLFIVDAAGHSTPIFAISREWATPARPSRSGSTSASTGTPRVGWWWPCHWTPRAQSSPLTQLHPQLQSRHGLAAG